MQACWSNFLNHKTFSYLFVASQTSGTSWVKSETGPLTQRASRDQRKRQNPRLVGGRLSKQGNLHTRLILGDCKTSSSSHTPARIFNVCIEAFTGFKHIYGPNGLNNTLLAFSRLRPWKWLPVWEQWAEHTFQGQVRGWRAFVAQNQIRFNQRSCPPTL